MQSIETLSGLERRVDLTVPSALVDKEVTARLNKLARTVRMPGFRPGKVPIKMVAASYGAQVQAEVLSDKVGEAFNAAVSESKLRVAGTPRVEPKTDEGSDLAFSAIFEVYPEIASAICRTPRSSGPPATSAMHRSTARSRSCGASAPPTRR